MISLPAGRPAIMGILNVTPDSFSDGGRYLDPGHAVEAAHAMVADRADWVDVGGESTRPGAKPVSADEELRRVLPVVRRLASEGIAVSIDTTKADVAAAALDAGAKLVNDVMGLRAPGMLEACRGAAVCIMHMQGEPRTMQLQPTYADVVEEVRVFLRERAELARSSGVSSIWVDPGIGFGKTFAHNRTLLQAIPQLSELGYPVLIGLSRKSFIGAVLGYDSPLPVSERLSGTLAAQVYAQLQGARILRVHDVREARHAAEMTAWLQNQELQP